MKAPIERIVRLAWVIPLGSSREEDGVPPLGSCRVTLRARVLPESCETPPLRQRSRGPRDTAGWGTTALSATPKPVLTRWLASFAFECASASQRGGPPHGRLSNANRLTLHP